MNTVHIDAALFHILETCDIAIYTAFSLIMWYKETQDRNTLIE